jgi:hypothetical protein
MQTTGHVYVDNQKILILCRQKKYTRRLKLRKSGRDGTRFEDEEFVIANNPDMAAKLLNGEVIEL